MRYPKRLDSFLLSLFCVGLLILGSSCKGNFGVNPTYLPVSTNTPTANYSPTSIVPTDTPTQNPIWTPTATPSHTPAYTSTPIASPTGTWFTPTATVTGCAKVAFNSSNINNLTSAGATVPVLDVTYYLCCSGSCTGAVVVDLTGLNLSMKTTGNLGTEILEAQLWDENGMVATSGISGSSFNFTGFIDTNNAFSVLYVLSSMASGTVVTTLNTASGTAHGVLPPISGAPIIPYYLPISSSPLTVQ